MYANSCLATYVYPIQVDVTVADPVSRLNTRRFVHGRGTDREEATIPTFVMVANTIHRPRMQQYQYPERDLERVEQDDEYSEDQQKGSVAPDLDKVVHSTV